MASKKRVVLVESESGHRKLLGLNLGVYVGVEVVYKYNADDVIRFLKQDSDIQAIVSQESVGGAETILKIYYYIISNALNIPIILSGHCSKLIGKIDMYPKKDWHKIVKKCAAFLNVDAKDMVSKEIDKYYPVPIEMFFAMATSPVDVFTHEDGGIFKFFLSAKKNINQERIRKCFLANESYLFVLSKDRIKFVEDFSKQVFKFIKKQNLSVEDRVKVTGMAFERAHETIKSEGMNVQTIKMAKAAIESVVTIASSSCGLSDLMDILYDSEESYLYRHSLLISIVSYQIIGEMGWGNKEQKVKIAFAAFFHDITIPDENLCRINSEEELNSYAISEQDKNDVLRHACNGTELIKNMPDVPFGVDTIMLQHHGALNGVGFKREEKDGRITFLSKVFLVVEDYVDCLLGGEGHERAMEELSNRYSQGDFQKIVTSLGQLEGG